MANKISADAVAAGQADPVYVPYLFLATDGTGINTGMLVKSTRVTTVKVPDIDALNDVGRIILLAEASAMYQPYLSRRDDFGPDVLALVKSRQSS